MYYTLFYLISRLLQKKRIKVMADELFMPNLPYLDLTGFSNTCADSFSFDQG